MRLHDEECTRLFLLYNSVCPTVEQPQQTEYRVQSSTERVQREHREYREYRVQYGRQNTQSTDRMTID